MKIMQICFSPIVNSTGGAEKVYCNMSNYFCKNHSVIDVCCDSEEGLPVYEFDEQAKFINLNTGGKIKIPFRIKVINEVVRLIKQMGVGLEFPKEVYVVKQIKKNLKELLINVVPDFIICYELRSMVAIEQCGYDLSKVIVMFHNNADIILNSISNKQENILKKVKYVQVLLESDKDKLVKKGFCNVVCIGNIVPQFNESELNNENKQNVIICAGRLDKKQKRQHLLIEAFRKIADRYPDWQVRFFGGDSTPVGYEQDLRNLIKDYNLENQVFLMGKTDEMIQELKKASIFAFPSAFEGFPLALTEAMSLGLPSIGFKGGLGVNEMIIDGYNGILCEDSTVSLSQALEILIKNEKQRITYGKNAVASVKKYSAENIFNRWIELFGITR